MSNRDYSEKSFGKGKSKEFDSCPHCGAELSPWEKVLLNVDRALMCKHCWYKILLDLSEEESRKIDKTSREKPRI